MKLPALQILKQFSFAAALVGAGAALGHHETPIDQCNYTISGNGGRYKLVSNLDCSNAPPFYTGVRILNASNVTLKLKGYNIKGKPANNPNGTPTGRGIMISNSSNIKIEGDDDSRIEYTAMGIQVFNSPRVEIDGDQLRIVRSGQGVSAVNSDRIKVKELRLSYNLTRDIFVSNSDRARIEDNRLFRPGRTTTQGILLNGSEHSKLEDNRVAIQVGYSRGLIVSNSFDTDIKDNRIGRNQVGLLLTSNTSNTLVKDNRFGNPAANTLCDLQVVFGADEPELDDNSPSDNLTRCN